MFHLFLQPGQLLVGSVDVAVLNIEPATLPRAVDVVVLDVILAALVRPIYVSVLDIKSSGHLRAVNVAVLYVILSRTHDCLPAVYAACTLTRPSATSSFNRSSALLPTSSP